MKINEYLLADPGTAPVPPNNSSQYRVTSGEFFYDFCFLKQLRLETLRAQRSKSTLSIILLTLDKETDAESINMNEILGVVREKHETPTLAASLTINPYACFSPIQTRQERKKFAQN